MNHSNNFLISKQSNRSFALLSLAAMLAGLLSLSGTNGLGRELREPMSIQFPQHKLTSDMGDILSDYPDYLKFVLEIGRVTDGRSASLLAKKYAQLRQRNPELAARFLRGLRFEMVQKLEFVGGTNARITTDTPFMRNWVTKFIREWAREADEYLYRSYGAQLARRNS